MKKKHTPYNPPHTILMKNFELGKIKCRRRFHRDFFKWYIINKSRFMVKLTIKYKSDYIIIFSFQGYNPSLEVKLCSRHEIEINVIHNGVFYDSIRCCWAWPQSVTGGYIDVSLLEDCQQKWPSRQKIWELGVFEDFLKWVNNKLYNSSWIKIEYKENSWSSARLVADNIYCNSNELETLDDGVSIIYLRCKHLHPE